MSSRGASQQPPPAPAAQITNATSLAARPKAWILINGILQPAPKHCPQQPGAADKRLTIIYALAQGRPRRPE